MKLLLDTHALLWTINQDKRLPSVLIDLIEDPGNDVFVSMASIWEASIKIGLDRAANNPEVRELSQHTSIEEVAQTIEETLPTAE